MNNHVHILTCTIIVINIHHIKPLAMRYLVVKKVCY